MLKRREPQISGLAWTEGRLYLVNICATASYEHVARLTYCRALMRDDPDYAELRDKRVSMVLLCLESGVTVLDFARRQRVKVVASTVTSYGADSATPAAVAKLD